MIAVAKIGGHQEIVKLGDTLQVDKLDAKVGETVKFETLLISSPDGADFQVGTPLLKGVYVEAKVLEQGRSGKLTVYKMARRKRYRRTIGHRQDFTGIEITKIGVHAAAEKTEKKAAPKKEEKTEVKKAAPTKTAEKKVVEKKAPAKKVVKTEKKS